MTKSDYQGIGTRLAAYIVDTIVLMVVFFILGFRMSGSFNFQYSGMEALPFIGGFALVTFLYFVVLEGTSGATIGKKLLKIRVVREDGSACGFGPSFVRNILRIVDGLPALYIIGMVLIARSDKKQRLGDRLARTVVIKA
jgi:uncharacterized RDD family membrane protein YckC